MKGQASNRAEKSGIFLSSADVAVVKGMLARGDRQHDIAAWFGVNGGRIAEVNTGEKFATIQPKVDNLPPPGPYISGRASDNVKQELLSVKRSLENLLEKVEGILQKM